MFDDILIKWTIRQTDVFVTTDDRPSMVGEVDINFWPILPEDVCEGSLGQPDHRWVVRSAPWGGDMNGWSMHLQRFTWTRLAHAGKLCVGRWGSELRVQTRANFPQLGCGILSHFRATVNFLWLRFSPLHHVHHRPTLLSCVDICSFDYDGASATQRDKLWLPVSSTMVHTAQHHSHGLLYSNVLMIVFMMQPGSYCHKMI